MAIADAARHIAFDAARFRADFPILSESLDQGMRLSYLDNAATTQKPLAVIKASDDYYRHANANVHRAIHALSQRATRQYEGARDRLMRFINASARSELVYTRGTTDGINLVAQCYARPRLKAGDEILLTELEHHSNIVPWQIVAKETTATIVVVPVEDDGSVSLEAFKRKLSERTAIAAFAHISNALGTVNPVDEIIAEASGRGIVTVVDGAQSVPHGPVDLRALDCDFFAFSGHKVFGPMGIGVLYGKAKRLAEMPPYQGGGDMIDQVTIEKTTFAPPPQRFEAGTPNVAGTIGLGTALEYFDGLDHAAVAAHEQALLGQATAGLEALPGLTIHGQAPGKAAVLSFTVDGVHPHDIATFLDTEGIAIRAGHHCCQPLMARLGETATARASFAFYNLPEEVDRLVATVSKTIDCFR